MQRAIPVESGIDGGGRDHTAQRRQSRQSTPRPGRQRAMAQLMADLQPHQQEEQGHQPVIDPVMDTEARNIRVQGIEIGRRLKGELATISASTVTPSSNMPLAASLLKNFSNMAADYPRPYSRREEFLATAMARTPSLAPD